MKKIYTIIAVLAVLVSVEAKAQLVFPVYNSVGDAADNGAVTTTTDDTDETAAANPYTVMQLQMAMQQLQYQQLLQTTQYNYALENLESPANQEQLQAGLESDVAAAAHAKIGQNKIYNGMVDVAVKKAVTCNPDLNMLVNPACMNIDLSNMLNRIQVQDALHRQQDAAVFANFI